MLYDEQASGSQELSIHLHRHLPLLLKPDTPKGRGVFAEKFIPSGIVIDTCPVLILDPVENAKYIEKTALHHYTYNWPIQDGDGTSTQTQAVVFGLGSMFNHSKWDPNVGWTRDLHNQLIVYRALRDISAGEELCISYGDHLTFMDADNRVDLNGHAEDEEQILQRIELG